MFEKVEVINNNLENLQNEMEEVNKGINYFGLALIYNDESGKVELKVDSSEILKEIVKIEEIKSMTFYDFLVERIDFKSLDSSLAVGDQTRKEFITEIEKEFNKFKSRLEE